MPSSLITGMFSSAPKVIHAMGLGERTLCGDAFDRGGYEGIPDPDGDGVGYWIPDVKPRRVTCPDCLREAAHVAGFMAAGLLPMPRKR